MYQAYQIRNDIVHNLKNVRLTKTKVIKMWDNALNIIEIGQTIIDRAVTKEGRAEIDRDYQRGLIRQKTIDLYRFRSEKLMVRLLEGEIQLTKRQNLTMAELVLARLISCNQEMMSSLVVPPQYQPVV